MAKPARYDFPFHKKGDTFTSVTMVFSIDGVSQSLDNMQLKMMIKRKPIDVVPVVTWSIDSGITIVDGPGGVFKINPGIVDIPAMVYYYDLQFTFESGEVETFVEGTLNVVQDVTT